MKERLKYIGLYFTFWLSIFVIQKPIFLLFQFNETKQHCFTDLLGTIVHGFCMDLSMASYCTLLPLILIIVSCFFTRNNWIDKLIGGYTYLCIILFSFLFVADLYLYKYWAFRIDTTPLFYLKTPKDALASGSWSEYFLALVTLGILLYLSIKWYRFLLSHTTPLTKKSFVTIPICTLLFGILFILIRGGIGVSTMNVGYVYFSNSTYLNHAAINPIWNFFDSCTSTNDFGKQYRMMDDTQASLYVTQLNQTVSCNDSLQHTPLVLNTDRPNIVLIIMEGIGSNVIESLNGVANVAPNLSRYAKEGLCFTNCFASSFRTDRGLVAILSGYPAQPTNSLMKYPNKTQNVPILSQVLKKEGYETAFYYGGDDNFTNLHSFLVTGQFQTIINETDFVGEDLSTKWGAYDHVLFQKVKEDLDNTQSQPFFKTILTLNSHEPFDVPSHTFENPYLNSVHYADSCIGNFIDYYKNSEFWDNSLIILLPDHAYRYPEILRNEVPYRYRIPLIWTGGAVSQQNIKIEKTCSQIDLAATLLHQLKIDSHEFIFSHDILDTNYPEYAFYSFIDGFGLIQQKDTAVYDCGGSTIIQSTSEETLNRGKAYLQTLYDDLSKR